MPHGSTLGPSAVLGQSDKLATPSEADMQAGPS